MFEAIFKRQSIRKYKMEKSNEIEEEINSAIRNVHSLNSRSTATLELVKADPDNKKASAPYYIFLRADKDDKDNDAAGFIGEQAVLRLTKMGYGTCWQVGSGPRIPVIKGKRNLAKIAVGKSDQELYQKDIREYKRVAIEEICGGNCDKTIAESVRLAPSAINLQPWYIHGEENIIHVYRRKCAGPLYLKKVTSLDIGIALCHIQVTANHLGINVTYEKREHPEIKDKKYITSVILHKGEHKQ